jgi:hypothetical protein
MELRFEEGERQIVAARLGLSADASEDDLQARLAAWIAETPEPAPGDGGGDGGDGGDTGDGGGEGGSDDAEAGIDDLDDQDVVVVDALSYRRLQQRDRIAGQIEAANRERDRNELIAEAVHDGKISPGRAQHYSDRYDSDPEGTTRLLARLTPNTIPLEERGVNATQDDADDTSAYPTEWLTHGEVAAASSGGPAPRRNRVTKD